MKLQMMVNSLIFWRGNEQAQGIFVLFAGPYVLKENQLN